MSIVLKKEYENLTVVNLDDGVSFVHDNKTGKNYFMDKTIAHVAGMTVRNVRKHKKKYKAIATKGTNSSLSLEVSNSDKPVEFNDFDFLTYVVYRSDKTEAIQMRNYISNAIDEKFNADTGFTQTGKQLLTLEEKLQRENNALVKQIMHKQLEISNLEIENAKIKKLYYREKLAELQEDSECLK